MTIYSTLKEGKMKNHKGFTLVECMSCMMILSLLSALTAPVLKTMRQRTIFHREVAMLVHGLQEAKVIAIKRNCFVVLTITNSGYKIFVDNGENNGTSGDWIRQKSEKIILDHAIPAVIRMATTFPEKRTRFNGKIGNTAGRIILTDSIGKRTEVVVNVTGRIRVQQT